MNVFKDAISGCLRTSWPS